MFILTSNFFLEQQGKLLINLPGWFFGKEVKVGNPERGRCV